MLRLWGLMSSIYFCYYYFKLDFVIFGFIFNIFFLFFCLIFCFLFGVVVVEFDFLVVNKFLFIFVFGVIFIVGVVMMFFGFVVLGVMIFVVVVWLGFVFFVLLLKLNVFVVEEEVIVEVIKLGKLLVGGVKLNVLIVWVFVRDFCNLLVLEVVDVFGMVGVNVGLKIGVGFIVMLGVVVILDVFLGVCGGEVVGLKVIIGGLGLLLLLDLKMNFVLYCGFVEDFWVSVVAVINVVFVMVFVVMFFVL